MNRRLSWVGWLTFGVIAISILIFFFGECILRLRLPSDDGQTAAARYAFAPLAAVFMSAQVASVGLSLLLVNPLLRLGPRAPLWLIPLAGAVLGVGDLIGENRVCRPFERELPFGCSLSLEVLCPILIVLGMVLLIRKAQLSSKSEPGVSTEQSS